MKKRYLLGIIAICLLPFNYAHSQISSALDQELQETLDSMRTVLGAKSLSAAIQTSDESIWADASGISYTMPGGEATPDHLYLIGSVTKTLTAACILQLADEGLLSIDDSLYEWLPTMPYIDTTITIRQLLNHTSGIYEILNHPHHYDSLMADMSRIWTPEELIDRFISPPAFQPGASWAYCNTNYFLLSMIIKQATGNDFYTELRNRFFDTLSLSSFGIPAFENLNGPVAHCWLDLNGDSVLDDGNSFYMSYMSLNSTAGAAGGYFSSPTDCTKWMRSYMRGDILSEEMMNAAKTTVQVGGNIERYGLGLMRKTSGFLGYEAYGHGGDLAYHASSWYFPALDQSITVFTNDGSETSWSILPVVRELLRTYIENQDANLESTFYEEIKVSPNPFSDKILISCPNIPDETITVRLTDAQGRLLICKTETTNNNSEIQITDLELLSAGNYFIEISSDNNWSKSFKIVK